MPELRSYYIVMEDHVDDRKRGVARVQRVGFEVADAPHLSGPVFRAREGLPPGMRVVYTHKQFERSLYMTTPDEAIDVWRQNLRERIAGKDREASELRRRFGLKVDPGLHDGAHSG